MIPTLQKALVLLCATASKRRCTRASQAEEKLPLTDMDDSTLGQPVGRGSTRPMQRTARLDGRGLEPLSARG